MPIVSVIVPVIPVSVRVITAMVDAVNLECGSVLRHLILSVVLKNEINGKIHILLYMTFAPKTFLENLWLRGPVRRATFETSRALLTFRYQGV